MRRAHCALFISHRVGMAFACRIALQYFLHFIHMFNPTGGLVTSLSASRINRQYGQRLAAIAGIEIASPRVSQCHGMFFT